MSCCSGDRVLRGLPRRRLEGSADFEVETGVSDDCSDVGMLQEEWRAE